jgi:hypothetical protein
MRRLRFRLWMVMVLVAFVAVACAGARLYQRRTGWLREAASHAAQERSYAALLARVKPELDREEAMLARLHHPCGNFRMSVDAIRGFHRECAAKVAEHRRLKEECQTRWW